MVAVFIVSIALVPVINKALSMALVEAGREKESSESVYLTELSVKERKSTLKRLLGDYRELFLTYGAVFLGVFFAFALLSLLLPSETANVFLGDQLRVLQPRAFDFGFFEKILLNNVLIIIVSFVFSALFELGTTFIIVWNASAWGAVFAAYAKDAAVAAASDPLFSLILLLIIVLPHTILEAMAYFSSAISGGIAHKALLKEKLATERSNQILRHAVLLIALAFAFMLVGAVVETFVSNVLH